MNRMAMLKAGDEGMDASGVATELGGQAVHLDPSGAIYLPESRLLCVSDLHLEKGAAFARRGQLLPPWDTLATLKLLGSVIARHDPKVVVSLGDNFHDRVGSAQMPEPFRAMIIELARGRDWIWISGNHDPDGVVDLPGLSADSLAFGGIDFRHEPEAGAATAEISGHLHPVATLLRRDKAVRRPCFASDGKRMIMPSFGVMTGGLDLRHKAFSGLFSRESLVAHMLGRERIYSMPFFSLSG